MPKPSLDAFLGGLRYRLRRDSPELMLLATQRGISSKLWQWRELLTNFWSVLGEANEKQEKNVDVKTWLDDVQDVADDVEDILDEFAIQASRRKLVAETQDITGKKSFLKNLFASFFTDPNSGAVTFDDNVRSKMVDISIQLEKLNIQIRGSSLDDARNELVEKNVLDMLQPHTNLKELTIKNYSCTRFSSWVGDPSFSNMVVLRLESCKNCTSLPALGCLDALKELTIKGMTALKNVGSKIYGRNWSDPFYSLETLCFKDLQEWEHWDSVPENECIEIFPNLCELSFINCPNLVGKLPDHLPSLKKLIVHECGQLMVPYSSLPEFCELEVDG